MYDTRQAAAVLVHSHLTRDGSAKLVLLMDQVGDDSFEDRRAFKMNRIWGNETYRALHYLYMPNPAGNTIDRLHDLPLTLILQ